MKIEIKAYCQGCGEELKVTEFCAGENEKEVDGIKYELAIDVEKHRCTHEDTEDTEMPEESVDGLHF